MSHPLLSEALKEAFVTCNGTQIVETLTVSYGSVKFGICSGFKNRVFESVTYNPMPFKFSLPPQSSGGSASVNIDIENINGAVLNFIRTAKANATPVKITYRMHNEATMESQTPRPVRLILSDASVTLQGVKLKASVSDMVNRSFPHELYTFALFPGLR